MSALSDLANGERTGKREQTVLTGDPILHLLTAFWGRTALDPCAPTEPVVRVPCDVRRKRKHPDNCKHCGGVGHTVQRYTLNPERAISLPDGDGLAERWTDRTFCNPEYARLEPWLLHDDIAPDARVLWYVPSRSHRRWWRKWARERCADVIALNPQKFKGYTCGFPAPLVLGYRGPQGHVALLRELCARMDLGESLDTTA